MVGMLECARRKSENQRMPLKDLREVRGIRIVGCLAAGVTASRASERQSMVEW